MQVVELSFFSFMEVRVPHSRDQKLQSKRTGGKPLLKSLRLCLLKTVSQRDGISVSDGSYSSTSWI